MTPLPRRIVTARRRAVPALRRAAVLVVITLITGIGFAGPAAAHNVLIGSDPADGSTVQIAPTSASLTFNLPVENFEPVVTVTGPDGQHHETGSPTIDSTVVSTGIGPLTAAGPYTVAYRIVSADGHPVEGQIHFTLDQAAITANPAAAPPSTGTTQPSGPPTTSPAARGTTGTSSGLPGWAWVALAIAAALIAAVTVIATRRDRR